MRTYDIAIVRFHKHGVGGPLFKVVNLLPFNYPPEVTIMPLEGENPRIITVLEFDLKVVGRMPLQPTMSNG